MTSHQEAFNEVCYYTLAHPDESFIHQHVVDAFAAQDADQEDKPIRLTFALVGLYLHVEKNFTGKQVQRAHMKLASNKSPWPAFPLPDSRGEIDVKDVLRATAGPERDALIHHWCRVVWDAFSDNRDAVDRLLRKHAVL